MKMQLYVTCFVLLAASWVQEGDASKCNDDVLQRLYEMYEKYSNIPSYILEKNIELSPDTEVATTDGYFANQDNICCISTTWSSDGVFTSTFLYKDNTSSTSVGSAPMELLGQLYTEATSTTRYHVPTNGLVSAFYKCTDDGEDGAAEGLVKVWEGYEQTDLEEAIEVLEYVLGTDLSQTFPDSCDTCSVS